MPPHYFSFSDQGRLLHLQVIEHAQEASSACARRDLHGLLERLLLQMEEEVGRHMCWPRSQIVGGGVARLLNLWVLTVDPDQRNQNWNAYIPSAVRACQNVNILFGLACLYQLMHWNMFACELLISEYRTDSAGDLVCRWAWGQIHTRQRCI